jgi:hypothetical protein
MKHKLETGESAGLKCEPRDDRLDIARRLYRAMCAQHPDRLITLCDGGGRILEKTSSATQASWRSRDSIG